ncbi:hypothetical protein LTR10_012745 [Elasticomyces elasticus]|uniref:Uncharacterized protein n=1 Tax=Exophiala sideris TaxID=1016849 RepID=A0ABR0JRI4_9EURO|nr:hypothetical protein LTR10_012745 [Elasticomyces elasticus]KAK5034622.1 hypothetical protein LTR13_006278 [Exophiala sideris]KAK5040056.1 hypothetical protein LTS07_000552 [Exophiala sideris]KAK5068434.1 hypothetical protein LTR69_000553 [Exophiala sideris]KAK5187736.1 hypothetical protein LTR44_000553 [Eurotiomycetes sp. CCFEE 6388]
MSYDNHYTETEHLDVQFEVDGTQNYSGNTDDGVYGDSNDDNGFEDPSGHNGYHQHHDSTNGALDPGERGPEDDDNDDGARWPHPKKTKADLDMLIQYALAQASAAGLDVDSDGDEAETGEQGDERGASDVQHDRPYDESELDQHRNGHGYGADVEHNHEGHDNGEDAVEEMW